MRHGRRRQHVDRQDRLRRATNRESPDAGEAAPAIAFAPRQQRDAAMSRVGVAGKLHQQRVHEDVGRIRARGQRVPVGLQRRQPFTAGDLDDDVGRARLRPLRARVIQADNDGRTWRACVKRNAFVHAYQKSVV